MKKRLLSLIVAAAMLFGMLPVTTLGADVESAAPVHSAVYAESVTVGGTLDDAWLLNSKMTGTDVSRAFGTLWNSEALYLAVEKAAEDTEVSATVNNKALTVTAGGVTLGDAAVEDAAVSTESGYWEVKLPWSALGVTLDNFNIRIPAVLTAGGASWEGEIVISSLERYEANLRTFNKGHIASGDEENLECTALDNGFRMSNLYSAAGSNLNTKSRLYSYDYMEEHPLEGETLVLEYDFRADAMPEYVAPGDIKTIDSLNPCYGYTYYTANNMGKGFCAGITNTTDGLYLCFNGVTGEEIHAVKLNKQLGETFRVRMERDALGMVRTYIDDVLVDTIESPSVPSGWGRMTNVLVVNLWSGSDFHPTEDGKNNVDFTVSNLRYGCTYDDLLKDITFDTIKGQNAVEDLISSDLVLPAEYTHPKLDHTYDLIWASSNTDVITDSGKVIPGMEDVQVDVTVTVEGDLGQKTFSLTVPRRFVTAYFTLEKLVADGILNEYSWSAAAKKDFEFSGGEGAPTGAVSVLMKAGVAYMAVEYDDADSMTLKLGEKSWTVDLTESTFSDTGIEGAIGDGVVELEIDMVALGMPIRDYNQTIKAEITLSKGELTSALDVNALDIAFVAKAVVVPEEYLPEGGEDEPAEPEATPVAIPGESGTLLNFVDVNDDGALVFDGHTEKYGAEIWQYADPTAELVNLTKPMLLEMTLDIDTLADAIYIVYEQWQSAASWVRAKIYNSGDGALSLAVVNKAGNTNLADPVALGKSVGGDAFKLGLLYNSDKTVKVYVDGVLIATLENAFGPATDGGYNGVVQLDMRSFDTTAAFTVADIQVTVEPGKDEGGEEEPAAPVVTEITQANYTSSGVFVNDGATAKLTSSNGASVYWIKQPVPNGLAEVDFTKDMLLEQVIDITSLPVSSGTFADASKANGLLIKLQEAETATEHAKDFIAVVIYNDGTSLKASVLQADGTASSAIDLGKTVTDEAFKLGIRYKANDDTVTVLVDGNEKGSVENGVYNYRNWGIKSVAYNYYDAEWETGDAASLTLSEITLTTSEPEEIVDDSPGTEIPLTGTAANSGYAISDRTLTLSGSAAHVTHQKSVYWIQQNGLDEIDASKDVLVEQTLCINKMIAGEESGTYIQAPNQVNGFNIMLEEPVSATHSNFVSVIVFNSGDGVKANVLKTDGTVTLVDLGVDLGEEFRIGVLRKTDGSVTVLVNGEEKATIEDGIYNGGGIYKKYTLLYYYRDTACVEGTEINMTITDPYLTVTEPAKEETENAELKDLEPLSEEISAEELMADLDLSAVTSDLTFPKSYDSKWLGVLPLSWTSSNEAYLTSDGKVTRPNGKTDQYALITATVVDGPKLWSVEATIPTTGTQSEQTPAVIMTSYTAADEAETGIDTKWSLNNKVLAGMVKNGSVLEGTSAAGVFGVRWGLENLYLAVKANGKTLAVTINGEAVDLSGVAADENGITYLAVSYEDVGLDAPTEYGVEIPAVITLGDAKWEGIFRLTSNENFIIDGAAERVYSQMAPGIASLGTSKPDSNQGVKKTETGWYFFDHFDVDGKNPESIRSYSILWAKGSDNQTHLDTYAPFDDRTHATYLEFDFYAASMPVYMDGSNSTGWSTSFASYGFTWAMTGSDGGALAAEGVSMGIYNTAEGLKFAVQNLDGNVALNRYVGDHFRLATRWNTDGSLTIYVDGEEIARLEGAQKVYQSYGHNSLMLNLIRSPEAPSGSQDNFDIYVDNITVAKGYGDTVLEFLDYEDLLGENEDRLAVSETLTLEETFTNEQTGWVSNITWTSDKEGVIDPATGEVTAPESKGARVTLTAAAGDETKDFLFYVPSTNFQSNILMVVGDTDTANGAGFMKDVYDFTLDTTNNSIILDQGESKTINVITLTDGDAVNRLNESFLSIWTSEDNVTYTRVDEYFKVLRDGEKTYLYDFTATGRYIKVHATHYNGDEADFIGSPDNMIAASYEDVFAAVGEYTVTEEVTVSNPYAYIAYDDAWRIALSDAGVAEGDEASIRVYLDTELLYHYVDGDEIVVRIPEIAASGSVTLTVLSGNDDSKDISNREGVHEVVYGTRETMEDDPRRWICSLGDGRLFSVAAANNPAFDDAVDWTTASDVVDARRKQITWSISEDGGLTWAEETVLAEAMSGNLEEDGWINDVGGITYDPDAGELGHGRLIFNGYYYIRFSKNSMENSFCQQRFMYSDDLGKTWVRCPEMTQTGDRSYYNIGYDDAIRLSCYDGEEGENIDYIMTVADQANNDGGFCLRVVYSRDGGLTWTMDDDKVDLAEGSGITAIESGVSEGFLIETTDAEGKSLLVLYSRCQYANSTKFAFSTSSDYGLTWEKATLSSIYASAGQPVMNPFGDANLMIWGGNHALGTNSYNIMPLTVGVMSDDMRSVSNIQDLYSRYSTQGMTDKTEVRVINQSADSNGDTMSITYWSRPLNLRLRVDNFTDYLYRTKGIYDSFENSTVKYEGWAITGGVVEVSGDQYSAGSKSMMFNTGSSAVRTIPYLQDGTVTMNLYVANAATADLTVELEAAYSDIYGTAAPVAIKVVDGKVYMLKCSYDADGVKTITDVDTGLRLSDGWNTVTFNLNLSADEPTAEVAINDSAAVAMPVDPSVGSYVCYVDINAISTVVYADEIIVVDTMPVTVPDAPAEPTDEVPTIDYHSVSLEGTVDANYYVRVPEQMENDPTAHMEFTKPNGEVVKVFLKDMTKVEYQGEEYYKFTCDVAAKEMTEDIQAKFYYRGATLLENEFCVKDYADYVLENSNDAELKALAEAMLQYGAYAQAHFNHNTENMANADLGDYSEALNSVTADTLSEYAQKFQQGTGKVKLYSVSLLLKSETIMRLFFKLDGVAAEEVTFTYGGKELTAKERDGLYYVDIANIAAKNLGDAFTVTVYDGEATYDVSYSPMTYCYNVIRTNSDENLVKAMKALYLYNQAAIAYFSAQ